MRIRFKKWARPELEASNFMKTIQKNGKENGKNILQIIANH